MSSYFDALPNELIFLIVSKIKVKSKLDALLKIYKFRLILNNDKYLLSLIKNISYELYNMVLKHNCNIYQLRMTYYYLMVSENRAKGYIQIKDVDLNAPGYLDGKTSTPYLTWEDIYDWLIYYKGNISQAVKGWLYTYVGSILMTPSQYLFVSTYTHNYDMFDGIIRKSLQYYKLEDVINILYALPLVGVGGLHALHGTRGSVSTYQALISGGILNIIETSIREKFS